jgi:hypothetical protein
MLNELGGLAGGLAQGINMGMQLRNQQQYLDMQQQYQDRMAKADERDSEIHEMRKDQYASEKDVRDRRQRAMQQIADYTMQALGGGNAPTAPGMPSSVQDPNAPSFGAPPAQQTPSSVKLAGPLPQGGLSMNAPAAPYAADNPVGTLGAKPQAPQQPQMPPSKVLEQGMVMGAYTPEMLTNIANIFAQHGLHEEGIKYMNTAYEAKKRGAVDAGIAFMQNNPGAAAEALQNGGIQLDGMPVKVKPDDSNDMNWKINIKGQGEKTINVRDWMGSTMNYEEFLKAEDRRKKDEREAAMDERKQAIEEGRLSNDTRKTNAEIGYLKSRSQLAEANAGKADRYEPGGLKPSRSSEAQISAAMTRREKTFDRVTTEKNAEGAFEVNPQKRQVLDSASNQYQDFLEDQLGEELDARQHHKFTDVMATYPIGGTAAQIKKWQKEEFLPRFGGKVDKEEPKQAAPGQPAPLASRQSPAPKPSGPAPGSLADMKEKAKARETVNAQMAAVQKALQAPNLSAEQKKALALEAQQIAVRRDALK